ncbi:MAG TPA: DUF488 domain-containing protein [Acidobacteriota bacterium]|nr:DUF488 domain-containing protein [Acidobacteriota bacterium]
MIKLKRVYETAGPKDGTRILVERLWPRGIKKTSLQLDSWLKDAAPSAELRRWFSHDPQKWGEFSCRYYGELNAHPDAWKPILDAARRGTVSLLYSSHDQEHNNAVALKRYLEEKL